MYILWGQVAQATRRLTRAELRGFEPGERSSEYFSSFIRVQTGPGIRSAACKMNTGSFPGVKTAESRASHPISS